MAAITEEVAVRARSHGAMRTRQRLNLVIFMGPAAIIVALFFALPVLVDIFIAFTDLGRTLQISEFSLKNFDRAFTGDSRLPKVLFLTAIYVFGTLAFFNVTFGLILALTTTALPDKAGGFFRTIWLLPRMSPSVVYIVLWTWSVHSGDSSLVNQVVMNLFGVEKPLDLLLDAPVVLIILANGFIGASFGMIILTSAVRGIPEHLFFAAKADGAGYFSIVRHITMPALRWPLTYIAIWQTLSLVVSFEYILPSHRRRPVPGHHGLRALYLPPRLPKRTVWLWRRNGPVPDHTRDHLRAVRVALHQHAEDDARAADRGALSHGRDHRPGSTRLAEPLG